eukprot:6399593-Prorocentrum_lima.AAC.1
MRGASTPGAATIGGHQGRCSPVAAVILELSASGRVCVHPAGWEIPWPIQQRCLGMAGDLSQGPGR